MAKKAQTLVPSTLAEVQLLERKIAQQLLAIRAAENDADIQINAIKGRLVLHVGPLAKEIFDAAKRVRAYADAHRSELTENGKHTMASLGSHGSVQWLKLPASLRIGNLQEALAHLRRMRLSRFIRKIEEVDKEALLKEQKMQARFPALRFPKARSSMSAPAVWMRASNAH